MSVARALQHLEDAETAMLSFMARLSELPADSPDDELPDAAGLLMAVARSVGRAAGILEILVEE